MEQIFQDSELLVLISFGILIMSLLALAFVLFFNFSQKRILKEKMDAQVQKLKHQQELLHNNILIQEKERSRIAKDLHDDLGSKLNVIKLNMYQLQKQKNKTEQTTQILTDIKSLINTTIDTTRRISHDLLPPMLENFGLIAALKELCEGVSNTDTVRISFEVLKEEGTIDQQMVALNIFRVMQEFISNSIKHGQAANISLNITLTKEILEINYSDDGKGFDLDHLANKKGLGMKNIESRVNMAKAKLTLDSKPNQGMKANIYLNLPA
ncbi:MAG: sensor histidine kinase [Saprospiraceae bacterium]